MNHLAPILMAVSLLWNEPAPGQQSDRKGGEISGTVRRLGGRRPIQTATVRLLDTGDDSVVSSTMTGDDGAFRFQDLKPGTYVVEVAALSFAKRRYWTHPETHRPLRISGPADSIRFDAELALLPRISGRVVDEEGESIPGVVVWALASFVATEQGLEWRRLTVLGGGGTDADGNFSIGNLLPGEYFIYAIPTPGSEPGRGFSDLPHGAKRTVAGYYPQARSIREARPVLLLPGETRTDLTIQLSAAQSFCAHGTVTGGESAKSTDWYINAIPDRTSRVTVNPVGVLRLAQGAKEFTMCGLPPEPLAVELHGPPPAGLAARTVMIPRKDERAEFRLDISPTFPLQINMRLESQTARWCKFSEAASASCYDTAAVPFSLQSPYTYIFMNPRASKESPGFLSIDSVHNSVYQTVLQLPRGLYLKRARLGSQELAPEDPAALDGSIRTLDLTIAESQAKLRIDIEKAENFTGNIYLVPVGPDAHYWRQIVSLPVPLGAGRADATGVAPGEYDVILASGEDPAAALAALRTSGGFPRVSIEPAGTTRISLKP